MLRVQPVSEVLRIVIYVARLFLVVERQLYFCVSRDILNVSRVMGFILPAYSGCSARPSPRQGLAKAGRPLYVRNKMKTVEERFFALVNKDGMYCDKLKSNCWEWLGSKVNGYGRFWISGRNVRAHIFSYTLVHGNINDGLETDHLCRNRSCCNPEHLERVTHSINVQRSFAARTTKPKKIKPARKKVEYAKFRCGHAIEADNTIVVRGAIKCKKCAVRYFLNNRCCSESEFPYL